MLVWRLSLLDVPDSELPTLPVAPAVLRFVDHYLVPLLNCHGVQVAQKGQLQTHGVVACWLVTTGD